MRKTYQRPNNLAIKGFPRVTLVPLDLHPVVPPQTMPLRSTFLFDKDSTSSLSQVIHNTLLGKLVSPYLQVGISMNPTAPLLPQLKLNPCQIAGLYKCGKDGGTR